MNSPWNILLPLLTAVGGFSISLLTWFRTRRRDDESEGQNRGGIASDIGYIKAGVDDLKRDNREIRGEMNRLSERITRVEESCKQAHKRLDEMKNQGD